MTVMWIIFAFGSAFFAGSGEASPFSFAICRRAAMGIFSYRLSVKQNPSWIINGHCKRRKEKLKPVMGLFYGEKKEIMQT